MAPRFSTLLLGLAIFVLALALRLTLTHQFVGFDAPPDANANPDQLDYEAIAWNLAQGNGYTIDGTSPTATRSPGVSLTILPVYLLLGQDWSAARIWMCVLSALTCVVVAAAASVYLGRGVGLLAGLVLAVWPDHAYYALHFLTEGPYMLYLAGAMWLTLLAVKHEKVWFDVLAGLCWGLALLTRPQIVFAFPFAALVVIFAGRRGWWPQGKRLAVQCVCIAICLSPWLIRNQVVMGGPKMSTTGGYTFLGAHNEQTLTNLKDAGLWLPTSTLADHEKLVGTEIERDSKAMELGLEHARNHLDRLPELQVMKLYQLLTPFKGTDNRMLNLVTGVSWLIAFPLVVIGCVVAAKRYRSAMIVFGLPIAATLLTAFIFYGLPRFRDAATPAMAPLIALALVEIFSGRIFRGRATISTHQLPEL